MKRLLNEQEFYEFLIIIQTSKYHIKIDNPLNSRQFDENDEKYDQVQEYFIKSLNYLQTSAYFTKSKIYTHISVIIWNVG